ncbi:MAG TPA: zf-HC2 domain-containing protein [Vicinamibacterales bacterium]|jgi:anti-sigma factor (TIGR02949 family)|nr:zf-HC2 domain-containing protein [Vicinamibacterales bacterium]
MGDIRNCRDVDEHLTPYVDGEETQETRRSLDAHISACPPCREHVESERSARQILHSHRGDLKVHAPEALRDRCARLRQVEGGQAPAGPRTSVIRRWVPLSLAATLVLAVTGAIVFGLNNRVEALAASLAIDHVKCFKVGARDKHVDPERAANRWQQNQGWPIAIPQTEPAEELRLLDVRRCFSSDGRAAHMMYTWRGAPLSVYVLQGDAGADRVVDRMGREAVIWCANRRTYAVVADGHPHDMAHIVDYMKARVR